jgi:hypothetical protein
MKHGSQMHQMNGEIGSNGKCQNSIGGKNEKNYY